MAEQSEAPSCQYLPNIEFFSKLFLPDPSISPISDTRGFPRGSSIIVTGKPGVGKAYFTLSVVRELMREKKYDTHQLWYVRVGSGADRLKAQFSSIGWFVQGDPIFSPSRAHFINIFEGSLPQPTRGAEELINPVMTDLRKLESRYHDPNGGVFVVIDSLTALVKDSRHHGDRRRSIDAVIGGVANSLGAKLSLDFLIVEGGDPEAQASIPEEEHLADFVLRLKVDEAEGGRRQRILEVAKCTDATKMLLGDHSWEPFTNSNSKSVIAPRKLRRQIITRFPRPLAGEPLLESYDRYGTIVVAPYPKLADIGGLQGWRPDKNATVTNTRIESGTPGLDEMLLGDTGYWARSMEDILDQKRLATRKGGLYEGSTTLLLGRAGTGKTITCLQFLLVDQVNPKQCLYVNFENRPQRVRESFPGDHAARKQLERIRRLYRRRAHLDLNLLVNEIQFLVTEYGLRRIAIDGLSDLLTVLGHRAYSRAVEDLLVSIRDADFRSRCRKAEQSETDGSGEASTRRILDPPITIFLSLEADASDSVISQYSLDSFADNVLVMAQVIINDEQRKTVQVLKARGLAPDRLIREVMILRGDREPLKIVPGFENYRNIGLQTPKSIRIAIQLVGENGAQIWFNANLHEKLNRLFGYEVKLYGFNRDEIFRTLLDIASGVGRIPYADVKLLNIDEWWVRELRLNGTRESSQYIAERKHPLLPLNHILKRHDVGASASLSYASDFWVFEMEKATVLRPVHTYAKDQKESEKAWSVEADVVALPSYLDYGLFCVNQELAEGVLPDGWKDEIASGNWPQAVPRQWVERDGRWFMAPNQAESRYLVDLMANVSKLYPGMHGFSYDMETTTTAACVFLELCWAFGAPEDAFLSTMVDKRLYSSDQGESKAAISEQPVAVALRFLAYLVVEGLMSPRTSVLSSKKALFSRQWYSTLNEPWDSTQTASSRAPNLDEPPPKTLERFHPMPYFPTGLEMSSQNGGVSDAEAEGLLDAIRRFGRLLARIEATIALRASDSSGSDWKDLEVYQKSTVQFEKRLAAGSVGVEFAKQTLDHLRAAGDWVRRQAYRSPLFVVGVGWRNAQEDQSLQEIVDPHHHKGGNRSWRHIDAAMFIDLRDVELLLDWNSRRLSLVEGHTPTGYTCEGSWLVAVDRSTRSPNLAAKFLAELTSTERNRNRAAYGAGIPARKDFYDFQGSDSVTRFPTSQVTWREFLLRTGARARRRERCFCRRLQLAAVIELIRNATLHCLTVANSLRDDYRKGGAQRDSAIATIADLADAAAISLVRSIAGQMVRVAREEDVRARPKSTATESEELPHCATCPDPIICREIFVGFCKESDADDPK